MKTSELPPEKARGGHCNLCNSKFAHAIDKKGGTVLLRLPQCDNSSTGGYCVGMINAKCGVDTGGGGGRASLGPNIIFPYFYTEKEGLCIYIFFLSKVRK
jgi:hypothetical protein